MKRLISPVFWLAGFLWTAGLIADDRKAIDISVGDWPPFFVEGESGQGNVARLVRDIFETEGYDVTFHFLPWKRAYREATAGRHSATAIWMHTDEREEDFIYSDAVMKERFVLFHRKGSDIEWRTMSDLAGLTLGASMGYSYGPEFDKAAEDKVLTVELQASAELNFRKLLFGRIDAFPEEINVGYHVLRREMDNVEARQITHHPTPILENESFLLFPRSEAGSSKLVETFNRRLKVFRESNRYDQYFDDHSHAALENTH